MEKKMCGYPYIWLVLFLEWLIKTALSYIKLQLFTIRKLFKTVQLKMTWIKRVEGIEPSRSAWKAGVLPLNYTRIYFGKLGYHLITEFLYIFKNDLIIQLGIFCKIPSHRSTQVIDKYCPNTLNFNSGLCSNLDFNL